MLQERNNFLDNDLQVISFKERFSKFFRFWPLFVILPIVFVFGGLMLIRNTVPKYVAKTMFLVSKTEKSEGNSSDLIEAAMSGNKQVNLNNEIILFGSRNLLKRTVEKNKFNISYFLKGRLLTTEIYKDAPFQILMKKIADSTIRLNFSIIRLNKKGGVLEYTETDAIRTIKFDWNTPISVSQSQFVLEPKTENFAYGAEYLVKWEPVEDVAENLSEFLSIKQYDPKTNVVLLDLKTENLKKGKDILNSLFNEFNQSDLESRKALSQKTINFIDERLVGISSELKGVEGNLENFQGSRNLVDVKSQSAQTLEDVSGVQKSMKDVGVQLSIAKMISSYFTNPGNSNKLVPSSLGLSDATLSFLISRYNELQLKKEREEPSIAASSPIMQDLNLQISNVKSSIVESLNSLTRNLELQENNYRQQSSNYKNFLSTVPQSERVLQEIRRKQSITEGLYLYLLQKREEVAISGSASNTSYFKQIDPADGYGPVEPNKFNIYIASILSGFFTALAIVYIISLFNDKVAVKTDITSVVRNTILGEVSNVPKKVRAAIAVLNRDAIGEQFRIIRTNLAFLLKDKGKKVVLVTSSVSGEGKSIISLNIASAFAISGKKVALLEFDLRKPVFNNTVPDSEDRHGICGFLSGNISSINDIHYQVEAIPSLSIFPAGAAPLNPTDLLLTENLGNLFDQLKEEYDYIFVDSPPTSLVSDPFIICEYCDLTLYIIRYQTTERKYLYMLNEFSKQDKLKDINLILNGATNSDYYNYQYNYGNGKKSKQYSNIKLKKHAL